MNKQILLVHGPNLNMLGRREPEHYGRFTLADIELSTEMMAKEKGFTLLTYQSNYEGALIDFIQSHYDDSLGLLINAGALTHYSYALLDCLKICPFPVVEVHISDIDNREDFRKVSVIREACISHVSGLGRGSYESALNKLIDHLNSL